MAEVTNDFMDRLAAFNRLRFATEQERKAIRLRFTIALIENILNIKIVVSNARSDKHQS